LGAPSEIASPVVSVVVSAGAASSLGKVLDLRTEPSAGLGAFLDAFHLLYSATFPGISFAVQRLVACVLIWFIVSAVFSCSLKPCILSITSLLCCLPFL